MNQPTKCILNLCFCCLFTLTILCSTPNISRSSEEFLSKLRSNIKLRKKYVEGKKPVEFTLLRVAGNDIDMTEFRKLNQKLGGRDEPEKQICIITLRNHCKNSSTNAENCMVRLIRGLQIHLNHNGNAVLLDEVGVSIDFIKEAYIADYDKITKTTSEFYGKFTKLEEIIINNLYMISCDAFLDIFMVTMFDFLCTIDKPNYKDQTFPGYYLEKCSKNKAEELRKILMGLVNTGKVISKPRVNFWRNDSAETAILSKMYKYEKDNCVKILSDRYQYVDAYSYLLKVKYVTAYKESTIHLIMSICNALMKSDIAEIFTLYFSAICREFFNFYLDLKDSNRLRSTFEDNVKFFCRTSYAFLDKTQSFSKELLSEGIMRIHNETIQPLAETLKQDLMAESVTRIFYDKKLTRKTVYKLCSILQNSNALSDFCKHQLIYINRGKGILKGKEHTLIDHCDSILSDCNSFDSVMEIKSTVQTLNENTKTTACQIFTYTRRKIDGKIETGSKYSDLTKKANGNLISIEKYTEPMGDTARKEHIEKCIKKYVDGVENIIFESWLITVANDRNQSLIYMITYGENDVSDEKVLLIFDVPFADRPANCLDSRHSDRYIRCIEDAQEPVLHNLNDNLQALQLATCIKLDIPNVCCALAYDYTYTEKIFTETGFNSPKEFVYEYLRSTQLTGTIHHLCKRIPITIVLDYKKNGCLNTKHLFITLAEQGISIDHFEMVLRRLIKTERSSGSFGMVPNSNNGLSDFRKIEIFYGLHLDGTLTFYMFEVRERSFNKNSITNPIKLLCKMLDHQELSGLYKALDLTQNYNCKTTFLTSIIDIICRLIFDKNYHKSSRKFLIDFALCLFYIEDSIREHKKSMVSSSDTCRGRSDKPITLFQKAFDKLVDPNDIIYFAKTIVQELQILSSARVIVITSIDIHPEKISSQPEPDSLYTILRKILNLY